MPTGNTIFCMTAAQWHCPGTSPSQIILTTEGEGDDVELTPQCLLGGTARNPFDWSMGFPTPTPVRGPWGPDSQNNVTIENITLKTMWNGLIDAMGWRVEQPHTCVQAQSGRPQAPACGHAREAPASKQAAPTSPLSVSFTWKCVKSRSANKL